MTPEEIGRMKWEKQKMNQKKGYMLTVDLEYPSHLHKEHESFPLAVDQCDIKYEDLSPYSKATLHNCAKTAKTYKAKKLCATLGPRKNYTLHYMSLRLYTQLGMKLTKVHSVIEFDQSAHLKPYIDLTTELRKKSTSVFKANIWKKFNNSGE
jgi:hypothetical protein